MDMPLSERRQIENEMIFRRLNEKVGNSLDSLDKRNIREHNPELLWDDATLLNFKCECSDEDCDMRIPVKLSVYKKIHTDRDTFIIKPEHQVEDIEEVIVSKKDYSVVRKNNSTAEPNNKLNDTSINNT